MKKLAKQSKINLSRVNDTKFFKNGFSDIELCVRMDQQKLIGKLAIKCSPNCVVKKENDYNLFASF